MQQIPLLRTRAGPRDGEQWQARLREELQALIAFVKMNKEADNDWWVCLIGGGGVVCWMLWPGISARNATTHTRICATPRFRIECNKTGTRWTGKCWAYHEGVKHEFELHFEIPGAATTLCVRAVGFGLGQSVWVGVAFTVGLAVNVLMLTRMHIHASTPAAVTYPATHPELCMPELEGKTAKMYRGGKICLVRARGGHACAWLVDGSPSNPTDGHP